MITFLSSRNVSSGVALLLTVFMIDVSVIAQDSRPTSGPTEVRRLEDEWSAAKKLHDQKLKAASTGAERAELIRHPPDAEAWNPKFWAIVDRDPKSGDAFDALLVILKNAEGDEETRAIDALTMHHRAAPDFSRLPKILAGRSTALAPASVERLIDSVADRKFAAWLAVDLARRFTTASYADMSEESQAARKNAVRLWTRCRDEFADFETSFFSGEKTKSVAEGYLFELEHLALGMKAPEMIGTDAENSKFAISDYRGKVLCLIFWGFWAGNYKTFRADEWVLVDRYQNSPFGLVGINTDKDKKRIARAIVGQDINWRIVLDGRQGPLATRWNIREMPALFLIDHEGIIRRRDVYDGDLYESIEALLAEAKAALERSE